MASVIDGKAIAEDLRRRVRGAVERLKAEHGITVNENAKGVAWRPAGVSDGKGFVIVSHTGEIFQSGFLPATHQGSIFTAGDHPVPNLSPQGDQGRKPTSFVALRLEPRDRFQNRFGERAAQVLRRIVNVVSAEKPSHVMFTIRFDERR